MKVVTWKMLGRSLTSLRFLRALRTKPLEINDYSAGSKYNKFVYLYHGNGCYKFPNGEQLSITPGMLVFSPEGCKFISEWSKDTRICFVEFTLEDAVSKELVTFYEKPTVLFENTPNRIADLFDHLGMFFPCERRATFLRGQKLFFEILYELSIYFGETWLKDGNNHKVTKAYNYIREHFAEDFTIEQLAKFSDLSVSRLRTVIKNQCGKTPIELRNQMRLEKACEYLTTTEMNIGDIAVKVGFKDAFYFSNYFKQYMGISPSEYRKKSGR